MPDEKERYVPKYPLLAGALTGGFEIIVTYPIEHVKVQQQLLDQAPAAARAGAAAAHVHGESPLAITRSIVQKHGALGLYRGLSPWLFFAFPRGATRFSVYEWSAALLQGREHGEAAARGGAISPLNSMLAGTLAGTAEGIFVVTPMQNITIKMVRATARATARRAKIGARNGAPRLGDVKRRPALNRLSLSRAIRPPLAPVLRCTTRTGRSACAGYRTPCTLSRASRASSAASSAARPRPCSRAP